MDPVTLGYYAAVCATLGLLSPVFGGALARILIGALVGLGAVALLPLVRGVTGL